MRSQGKKSSLCCRLSPIVVDAIFQLDDRQISDLERKSFVKVDRLEVDIVSLRFLP